MTDEGSDAGMDLGLRPGGDHARSPEVDIHAAVFLEVNKPQPVVLFEVAKGWLTGHMPEIGEMHRIEK